MQVNEPRVGEAEAHQAARPEGDGEVNMGPKAPETGPTGQHGTKLQPAGDVTEKLLPPLACNCKGMLRWPPARSPLQTPYMITL